MVFYLGQNKSPEFFSRDEIGKDDGQSHVEIKQVKTYNCDQVRAVGYMLEPLKCIFCGSLEVVFLQYVDGGSGYCESCGEWQ